MNPVYSVNVHEIEVSGPPEDLQQSGVVWIRARADLRRIYTLAGDILASLGKDRTLSGKGRNQNEDVGLTAAWLNACETTDLVVQNAELIHPIIITGLVRLSASAHVTLWLLHQPPISDAVHKQISRHATQTAEYDQVPQPSTANIAPAATSPSAPPTPIPHVDFPQFLAAIDRIPNPERDRAAGLFHQQRREFSDRAICADDAGDVARQRMTALLCAALPDEALIPQIRAVQVAAWHRDFFVDVDLNVLLPSEERPRIPFEEADRLLLRYRQPHRAITVALTMRQIGIDRIADLTIAETRVDGNITIDGAHLQTTTALRCSVRAQRILRLKGGAQGKDRLLGHAPKSLATFVNDAAKDLGIQAAGRRIERQTDEIRWLKSLGVKIEPIP